MKKRLFAVFFLFSFCVGAVCLPLFSAARGTSTESAAFAAREKSTGSVPDAPASFRTNADGLEPVANKAGTAFSALGMSTGSVPDAPVSFRTSADGVALVASVANTAFLAQETSTGSVPEARGMSAESVPDAQGGAEQMLARAEAFLLTRDGVDGVQDWIDGPLAAGAGESSEFYFLALRQSAERRGLDFSTYRDALCAYLSEHEVFSAVTREKYALCLLFCGTDLPRAQGEENRVGDENAFDDAQFVTQTLAQAPGAMGVMSEIYGLHLATNCEQPPEAILGRLLALALPDGSFSLMGNAGDPDVTAMALCALAPYYNAGLTDVDAAVEDALSFLSAQQTERGGYKSYGVENAESAAQVLCALSCLGIDAAQDARFFKHEQSLFSALSSFQNEDGSFSHKAGDPANENANSQVYYALVSYLRFLRGEGSFFVLHDVPDADNEPATQTPTQAAQPPLAKGSYKLYFVAALVLVAAILLLVLGLKKRSKSSIFSVLIVFAVLISVVCLTDISSADDYFHAAEPGADTQTICVEVCADASALSGFGEVFGATEVTLPRGASVYDALIAALKKQGLTADVSGVTGADASFAYVRGIAQVREFDGGPLSGWLFRVNGTEPSLGCGAYTLSDGDRVTWVYTLTLGKGGKAA